MEKRTIKMVKKVTVYSINDRTFHIMQHEEGYYWGIEDKYLDKEINGGQGHRRKEFKDCIERINDRIRADELIAKGYSRMVAAIVATGAMTLEEAVAREKEMTA